MTRDWTEAEARAWLRASLPKGWQVEVHAIAPWQAPSLKWEVIAGCGVRGFEPFRSAATLRSACRLLIRAAKRAGIAVNQVQEPGGKS